MRYANYHHNGRSVNTAGDNLQIIAMDYIYGKMGINKDDIVYIDTYELDTYDGEYVILPVYLPLFNHTEKGMAGLFSPKIIPVFINLIWPLDILTEEETAFLRQHEPIGCRDERTMLTMRKYGISSYLNGCITVVFPKSAVDRSKCRKIYIVDVPKELMDFIPDHYAENAVLVSHNLDGNLDNAKKAANDIYQMYLNDAKLVITSLLHCAIPCMAAGIPVVFAKIDFPYRAAWVEKLLPLYTEDEFGSIDWNPEPITYEAHKAKIIELVKKRLFAAYDRYNDLFSVSYFYEQRNKKQYTQEYTDRLHQFIGQKWKKQDVFTYSIWGLTHFAKYTYEYISSHYPNAVLARVYDKYRKINFYGINSELPENILQQKEEFVFVTSGGASREAFELFQKMGKSEDSYFLLLYGDSKHHQLK